jgi:hypothetical protein
LYLFSGELEGEVTSLPDLGSWARVARANSQAPRRTGSLARRNSVSRVKS